MAIEEIVHGAVRRVSDALADAQSDVVAKRDRLVERAAACLATIGHGDLRDDWLSVADGETMAFSPKTVEGQPLLLNGKTTTFWAVADVERAVRAFHELVAGGAFDEQLASGGTPTISPKIEGERVPADADNGSLSTGGGRTSGDEVETRFTEQAQIMEQGKHE